MGSEATLIWGMVFGAVGVGYFIYGKRERQATALACGIGLIVFPYFVDGALWTVIVGAGLMLVPWFVRY